MSIARMFGCEHADSISSAARRTIQRHRPFASSRGRLLRYIRRRRRRAHRCGLGDAGAVGHTAPAAAERLGTPSKTPPAQTDAPGKKRSIVVNATERPKPIVLFVVHAASCRAHIGHLIANGFQVSTTAPPSAIAHATALQPDVIVLDCDHVCDVTAQLKRHVPTHHIPIISLIEEAPSV